MKVLTLHAGWITALLVLAWPCVAPAQQNPGRGGDASLSAAVDRLPAELKPPHRLALVIGAGEFKDPRVPKLPACANDARAVRDVLCDPHGGMFPPDNVTLLSGPQVTREQVTRALDRLGHEAGPDDLVIVFYSGHGAVDDRNRAYWVMHETAPDDLRATALPQSQISELLAQIHTRRLVAMIDACYSAATANTLGLTKALADRESLIGALAGDGRIVLSSSSADQLSAIFTDKSSPGYGYSIFSYFLTRGLAGEADADGDGVVDQVELFDFVRTRTQLASRQQGLEQSPRLIGELGGRFALGINADNLQKTAAVRNQMLASLKALYLDGKLTADQQKLGQRLLSEPAERLSDEDRQQRGEFMAVLDGKLEPQKLQRALDLAMAPTAVGVAPGKNDAPPAGNQNPPPRDPPVDRAPSLRWATLASMSERDLAAMSDPELRKFLHDSMPLMNVTIAAPDAKTTVLHLRGAVLSDAERQMLASRMAALHNRIEMAEVKVNPSAVCRQLKLLLTERGVPDADVKSHPRPGGEPYVTIECSKSAKFARQDIVEMAQYFVLDPNNIDVRQF